MSIAEGRLPRLRAILRQGAVSRMTSTLLYVSSVAWASYSPRQVNGILVGCFLSPRLEKATLLQMKNPDTGERMVRSVFRRDQVYHGPCLSAAPDLIVLPEDGYDFEAGVKATSLTARGVLTGAHTYDDAFVFIEGERVTGEEIRIVDPLPSILHLMGGPIPPDVDGQVIVHA